MLDIVVTVFFLILLQILYLMTQRVLWRLQVYLCSIVAFWKIIRRMKPNPVHKCACFLKMLGILCFGIPFRSVEVPADLRGNLFKPHDIYLPIEGGDNSFYPVTWQETYDRMSSIYSTDSFYRWSFQYLYDPEVLDQLNTLLPIYLKYKDSRIIRILHQVSESKYIEPHDVQLLDEGLFNELLVYLLSYLKQDPLIIARFVEDAGFRNYLFWHFLDERFFYVLLRPETLRFITTNDWPDVDYGNWEFAHSRTGWIIEAIQAPLSEFSIIVSEFFCRIYLFCETSFVWGKAFMPKGHLPYYTIWGTPLFETPYYFYGSIIMAICSTVFIGFAFSEGTSEFGDRFKYYYFEWRKYIIYTRRLDPHRMFRFPLYVLLWLFVFPRFCDGKFHPAFHYTDFARIIRNVRRTAIGELIPDILEDYEAPILLLADRDQSTRIHSPRASYLLGRSDMEAVNSCTMIFFGLRATSRLPTLFFPYTETTGTLISRLAATYLADYLDTAYTILESYLLEWENVVGSPDCSPGLYIPADGADWPLALLNQRIASRDIISVDRFDYEDLLRPEDDPHRFRWEELTEITEDAVAEGQRATWRFFQSEMDKAGIRRRDYKKYFGRVAREREQRYETRHRNKEKGAAIEPHILGSVSGPAEDGLSRYHRYHSALGSLVPTELRKGKGLKLPLRMTLFLGCETSDEIVKKVSSFENKWSRKLLYQGVHAKNFGLDYKIYGHAFPGAYGIWWSCPVLNSVTPTTQAWFDSVESLLERKGFHDAVAEFRHNFYTREHAMVVRDMIIADYIDLEHGYIFDDKVRDFIPKVPSPQELADDWKRRRRDTRVFLEIPVADFNLLQMRYDTFTNFECFMRKQQPLYFFDAVSPDEREKEKTIIFNVGRRIHNAIQHQAVLGKGTSLENSLLSEAWAPVWNFFDNTFFPSHFSHVWKDAMKRNITNSFDVWDSDFSAGMSRGAHAIRNTGVLPQHTLRGGLSEYNMVPTSMSEYVYSLGKLIKTHDHPELKNPVASFMDRRLLNITFSEDNILPEFTKENPGIFIDLVPVLVPQTLVPPRVLRTPDDWQSVLRKPTSFYTGLDNELYALFQLDPATESIEILDFGLDPWAFRHLPMLATASQDYLRSTSPEKMQDLLFGHLVATEPLEIGTDFLAEIGGITYIPVEVLYHKPKALYRLIIANGAPNFFVDFDLASMLYHPETVAEAPEIEMLMSPQTTVLFYSLNENVSLQTTNSSQVHTKEVLLSLMDGMEEGAIFVSPETFRKFRDEDALWMNDGLVCYKPWWYYICVEPQETMKVEEEICDLIATEIVLESLDIAYRSSGTTAKILLEDSVGSSIVLRNIAMSQYVDFVVNDPLLKYLDFGYWNTSRELAEDFVEWWSLDFDEDFGSAMSIAAVSEVFDQVLGNSYLLQEGWGLPSAWEYSFDRDRGFEELIPCLVETSEDAEFFDRIARQVKPGNPRMISSWNSRPVPLFMHALFDFEDDFEAGEAVLARDSGLNLWSADAFWWPETWYVDDSEVTGENFITTFGEVEDFLVVAKRVLQDDFIFMYEPYDYFVVTRVDRADGSGSPPGEEYGIGDPVGIFDQLHLADFQKSALLLDTRFLKEDLGTAAVTIFALCESGCVVVFDTPDGFERLFTDVAFDGFGVDYPEWLPPQGYILITAESFSSYLWETDLFSKNRKPSLLPEDYLEALLDLQFDLTDGCAVRTYAPLLRDLGSEFFRPAQALGDATGWQDYTVSFPNWVHEAAYISTPDPWDYTELWTEAWRTFIGSETGDDFLVVLKSNDSREGRSAKAESTGWTLLPPLVNRSEVSVPVPVPAGPVENYREEHDFTDTECFAIARGAERVLADTNLDFDWDDYAVDDFREVFVLDLSYQRVDLVGVPESLWGDSSRDRFIAKSLMYNELFLKWDREFAEMTDATRPARAVREIELRAQLVEWLTLPYVGVKDSSWWGGYRYLQASPEVSGTAREIAAKSKEWQFGKEFHEYSHELLEILTDRSVAKAFIASQYFRAFDFVLSQLPKETPNEFFRQYFEDYAHCWFSYETSTKVVLAAIEDLYADFCVEQGIPPSPIFGIDIADKAQYVNFPQAYDLFYAPSQVMTTDSLAPSYYMLVKTGSLFGDWFYADLCDREWNGCFHMPPAAFLEIFNYHRNYPATLELTLESLDVFFSTITSQYKNWELASKWYFFDSTAFGGPEMEDSLIKQYLLKNFYDAEFDRFTYIATKTKRHFLENSKTRGTQIPWWSQHAAEWGKHPSYFYHEWDATKRVRDYEFPFDELGLMEVDYTRHRAMLDAYGTARRSTPEWEWRRRPAPGYINFREEVEYLGYLRAAQVQSADEILANATRLYSSRDPFGAWEEMSYGRPITEWFPFQNRNKTLEYARPQLTFPFGETSYLRENGTFFTGRSFSPRPGLIDVSRGTQLLFWTLCGTITAGSLLGYEYFLMYLLEDLCGLEKDSFWYDTFYILLMMYTEAFPALYREIVNVKFPDLWVPTSVLPYQKPAQPFLEEWRASGLRPQDLWTAGVESERITARGIFYHLWLKKPFVSYAKRNWFYLRVLNDVRQLAGYSGFGGFHGVPGGADALGERARRRAWFPRRSWLLDREIAEIRHQVIPLMARCWPEYYFYLDTISKYVGHLVGEELFMMYLNEKRGNSGLMTTIYWPLPEREHPTLGMYWRPWVTWWGLTGERRKKLKLKRHQWDYTTVAETHLAQFGVAHLQRELGLDPDSDRLEELRLKVREDLGHREGAYEDLTWAHNLGKTKGLELRREWCRWSREHHNRIDKARHFLRAPVVLRQITQRIMVEDETLVAEAVIRGPVAITSCIDTLVFEPQKKRKPAPPKNETFELLRRILLGPRYFWVTWQEEVRRVWLGTNPLFNQDLVCPIKGRRLRRVRKDKNDIDNEKVMGLFHRAQSIQGTLQMSFTLRSGALLYDRSFVDADVRHKPSKLQFLLDRAQRRNIRETFEILLQDQDVARFAVGENMDFTGFLPARMSENFRQVSWRRRPFFFCPPPVDKGIQFAPPVTEEDRIMQEIVTRNLRLDLQEVLVIPPQRRFLRFSIRGALPDFYDTAQEFYQGFFLHPNFRLLFDVYSPETPQATQQIVLGIHKRLTEILVQFQMVAFQRAHTDFSDVVVTVTREGLLRGRFIWHTMPVDAEQRQSGMLPWSQRQALRPFAFRQQTPVLSSVFTSAYDRIAMEIFVRKLPVLWEKFLWNYPLWTFERELLSMSDRWLRNLRKIRFEILAPSAFRYGERGPHDYRFNWGGYGARRLLPIRFYIPNINLFTILCDCDWLNGPAFERRFFRNIRDFRNMNMSAPDFSKWVRLAEHLVELTPETGWLLPEDQASIQRQLFTQPDFVAYDRQTAEAFEQFLHAEIARYAALADYYHGLRKGLGYLRFKYRSNLLLNQGVLLADYRMDVCSTKIAVSKRQLHEVTQFLAIFRKE